MGHQTIIRINQVGRMANHMAQLMFAIGLQQTCQRQIKIEGFDIPGWSLKAPRSDTNKGVSVGSQLSRVSIVAAMIDKLKPPLVDLDGVIQRCSNFLGPHAYDQFFPLFGGRTIEDDRLLIHIRLGDVSELSHPYYGPIPISYYKYLIDKTGLAPVFMGELDETPYLKALRSTFPEAQFLPKMDPIYDFQTIRRAKNIAISVSSFAWFAAYMSDCQTIHVPIAGWLDPNTRPATDLLPLNDERFQFHFVNEIAWNNRYSDCIGQADAFRPMQISEVKFLKLKANLRTAPKNVRVQFGIIWRMLAVHLGREPY